MLSLGHDWLKGDCIDEWIQLKPMYQMVREMLHLLAAFN
jgi:hypothetical protein